MDGPFNLIAYCSRASGTRGAWGGAPFNSDFGQYQKQNIFIQKHFYLFLPPPRLLDFPPALSPLFIFMMLSIFSIFFDSTQFSATDLELKHVQEDHDRLMERHSALLTVSEHLLIFEQAVVVKTQNF